jgi:glycosyltransferase involved in cell wall biosynthesis
MKISFIIPSFDVGGTESSFIRMANYINYSDSQFKAELVYWFEGGELRKLIDPGVIITKLNVSNLFSLMIQLINYYNISKPAVVHTSMYMIGNIALISRIFSSHKPKIIIGARSDFDSICEISKNFFDKFLLKQLSYFFYKKADQIVAVSEGVKEGLTKSLKLESSKVKVIYNGILTKKHRDSYSVPPNHHWFGMENICLISSIGRLSPEKGIYELVCAFKKALISNNKLRLMIIGEGKEKTRIIKYLYDNSITEYVDIIGFKDDYYSYLSNSDIFILNSYYEGMPSILVEAVSTNAKIISTNCMHGPSELLQGVPESKLIDINNEDQLVDAINKFSITKKIKREKVEHLKNFYIEESIKKYIEMFKKITAN